MNINNNISFGALLTSVSLANNRDIQVIESIPGQIKGATVERLPMYMQNMQRNYEIRTGNPETDQKLADTLKEKYNIKARYVSDEEIDKYKPGAKSETNFQWFA